MATDVNLYVRGEAAKVSRLLDRLADSFEGDATVWRDYRLSEQPAGAEWEGHVTVELRDTHNRATALALVQGGVLGVDPELRVFVGGDIYQRRIDT